MDENNSPSRAEPGAKVDGVNIDESLPWGVYIPPSIGNDVNNEALAREEGEDGDVLPNSQHGGYVQIVDAKGKFFPCGFSRPVGFVMEAVCGKKRNRSEITSDPGVVRKIGNATSDGDSGDGNAREGSTVDCVVDAHPPKLETDGQYQKKTITAERLHPEEALFLHLRGLLRIQAHPNGILAESTFIKPSPTQFSMSTQDLFCKMLPECNIQLAAYLAYAHLRAQGYSLIRYTHRRMELLRRMHELKLKQSTELDKMVRSNDSNSFAKSTKGKGSGEGPGCVGIPGFPDNDDCRDVSQNAKTEHESVPDNNDCEDASQNAKTENKRVLGIYDCEDVSQNDKTKIESTPDNDDCEDASPNAKTENGDDTISMSSSTERFRSRPLRLKLSDDVAEAPPPCVVSLQTDEKTGKPNISLAYYAYNPNARFKRSNPGLPDFGVAVMPFYSDTTGEPTFDTLASLVSMCEDEENSNGGIPLRVVTVSDGGAVIAFGVTDGNVPSINKPNTRTNT